MYHGFPTRPEGRTGSHSRTQLVVLTAGSVIALSMLGLGATGGLVDGIGLTSAGPRASGGATLGAGSDRSTGTVATVAPTASASSPVADQTSGPTSTPTPTSPQPSAPQPSAPQRSVPPPSGPATPAPQASPETGEGGPGSAADADTYPVVGITDGDTIEVRVGATTERVRLIGLDAPELRDGECWSQMAANRMKSLVRNRSVLLLRDPGQADRNSDGHLLRHVSTDGGPLVAAVLIEGGFARALSDGEYEHQTAFRAAEERAKAKRLGIWGASCAGHQAGAAPAPSSTSTGPARPKQGGPRAAAD